jgi:hypothetical protein
MILVLVGFLFKIKLVMHLGAVLMIGANIGILCSGGAYLVSLPFTDSLAQGLACLFIPPYAMFYWMKHWHKMRKAIKTTVGAFLPMLLVGMAYVFYQEEPVINTFVEKKLPAVEQKVEGELEQMDPWKDDLSKKTRSNP